ncbi:MULTISPECIES: universal stress protein [Virgibacillus]|uniref:Universal stress protein n=1 Tax=Virgibacillus pantothenticus TaxID=1473 RepID=A0A0L0QQ97_VIRPA|nr:MULTISPECIES: universal stress protein [Virgibacillus]API90843.1 universal stress protein UspA [Virgibacillus sp. 6R]KNE20790.1 universal stress protein UspA [Virgibacillus pantothenticus]MBS7426721.1 universal stress protein [Virgibacillus sp. 19R1-5]MBU8566049.1 universal stress protein [Virgibacillus pantothenticus]MBU8602778.1 universal stress protein [Virgibacillus pantothenticus]
MKMKYKNIVVAVDGSEASEKAFKKSLDIAKRNDARLILAHVVDSRTFATAEAYDRTLAERADEYAKELLDSYVDNAKAAGLEDLVRCVEYGSPKVKIAKDIAKQFEADLIICGATGMNAVERFLIGSVSENITRYAKCDVLVVR